MTRGRGMIDASELMGSAALRADRCPITRRTMLRGLVMGIMTTTLAACGDQTGTATPPSSGPAKSRAKGVIAAATTTQIQDLVMNVGGDRVTVHGLLKPNVDPHDYEPTAQDVQLIGQADIVFIHGIGLDTWIEKTIKNANATAPVITTTTGITPLKGDAADPEGDPHVWFDPTLAQRMVTNIAEGLAQVDPAGAEVYRRNAQAYNEQIARMDTRVQELFNQLPRDQRKLVTNHDAFQYLANHFGLTIVGAVIPSLSDTAEPSTQDLNALIDTIRREHVKAIFAESSANPKVARQVANETNANLVDTLYGDTLGEPGSAGGTYLSMMVYDATTIVNALKS